MNIAEKAFIIEVETDKSPSWLKETMSGKTPHGYVPSNITSPIVMTEEAIVVAACRDEAIYLLRQHTGFRGRINRCYEVNIPRALSVLGNLQNNKVLSFPDGYENELKVKLDTLTR